MSWINYVLDKCYIKIILLSRDSIVCPFIQYTNNLCASMSSPCCSCKLNINAPSLSCLSPCVVSSGLMRDSVVMTTNDVGNSSFHHPVNISGPKPSRIPKVTAVCMCVCVG